MKVCHRRRGKDEKRRVIYRSRARRRGEFFVAEKYEINFLFSRRARCNPPIAPGEQMPL